MSIRKVSGAVLLLIGILLLLLFATADLTGLGENPVSFGPWQITGTIAGAVMAVIGLILLVKKSRNAVTGETGA